MQENQSICLLSTSASNHPRVRLNFSLDRNEVPNQWKTGNRKRNQNHIRHVFVAPLRRDVCDHREKSFPRNSNWFYLILFICMFFLQQGATLHVSTCPSVPGILFFQNFFSPNIFFFSRLKKNHFFMHFCMFHAILSAQYFFHPKFFFNELWMKQGAT